MTDSRLKRLKDDPQYKTFIELGIKDPAGLLKRVRARRCEMKGGLLQFIKLMWSCVEPDREFVGGWHIDAICEHLEAVTFGEITNLIINVPPGFAKSLILNVFWPGWEWGPMNRPSLRYMAVSYSQDLTARDNVRFRQVIMSDLYRELWGHIYGPSKIQFSIEKVANDRTGWKLATSIGGVGTGERGDRVIVDDPNSVKDVESDRVRDSTNQWLTEVMPSRLNDMQKSAIVMIQQRTHEEDATGTVLGRDMGYEPLIIPMRYDPRRRYTTSIGWKDPRGLDENGNDTDENEGTLAWPERFPESVVTKLEHSLGPFATAGQLQQLPVPRGGAIFDREWWQPWWIGEDGKIRFPQFEFVIASVDTAFTEKQDNDYSAMTVWGVFRDTGESLVVPRTADSTDTIRISKEERPKVMLMWGWQKRLTLHGPVQERPPNVSPEEWNSPGYILQRQRTWGLVEWVQYTANRYNVDTLLIETQAAGHSLDQELRRLSSGDWKVQLITARGDKTSRAYAVQHLFSNFLVHVPMYPDGSGVPTWANTILDQFSSFPRTRYKDIVDSGTHALQHLRDIGVLVRREEFDTAFEESMQPPKKLKPLYPV